MSPLSSPTARRFALVVNLSVLWKVSALVVFFVLVVHLSGGPWP